MYKIRESVPLEGDLGVPQQAHWGQIDTETPSFNNMVLSSKLLKTWFWIPLFLTDLLNLSCRLFIINLPILYLEYVTTLGTYFFRLSEICISDVNINKGRNNVCKYRTFHVGLFCTFWRWCILKGSLWNTNKTFCDVFLLWCVSKFAKTRRIKLYSKRTIYKSLSGELYQNHSNSTGKG